MPLIIDPLADHPAVAEPLARLHYAEWGQWLPCWTQADAVRELQDHCCRRTLPTTWVALIAGQLAGSVSLIQEDVPDGPPLTPWLASLYVLADQRYQGIGQALIARALIEAHAAGMPELFLYTRTQMDYYHRRGWCVRGSILYFGQPLIFMSYTLHNRLKVPMNNGARPYG